MVHFYRGVIEAVLLNFVGVDRKFEGSFEIGRVRSLLWHLLLIRLGGFKICLELFDPLRRGERPPILFRI